MKIFLSFEELFTHLQESLGETSRGTSSRWFKNNKKIAALVAKESFLNPEAQFYSAFEEHLEFISLTVPQEIEARLINIYLWPLSIEREAKLRRLIDSRFESAKKLYLTGAEARKNSYYTNKPSTLSPSFLKHVDSGVAKYQRFSQDLLSKAIRSKRLLERQHVILLLLLQLTALLVGLMASLFAQFLWIKFFN